MKEKKFAVRRRMAKTAFITIIASVFMILACCFWGGSDVSGNLKEASAVLMALYAFLTSIVLSYYGAVSVDDYQKTKVIQQ